MAQSMPESKGCKKILKFFEMMQKAKLVLPQTEQFYPMFSLEDDGSLRSSKIPPEGFNDTPPAPAPNMAGTESLIQPEEVATLLQTNHRF
jgi:hypothetical protein